MRKSKGSANFKLIMRKSKGSTNPFRTPNTMRNTLANLFLNISRNLTPPSPPPQFRKHRPIMNISTTLRLLHSVTSCLCSYSTLCSHTTPPLISQAPSHCESLYHLAASSQCHLMPLFLFHPLFTHPLPLPSYLTPSSLSYSTPPFEHGPKAHFSFSIWQGPEGPLLPLRRVAL